MMKRNLPIAFAAASVMFCAQASVVYDNSTVEITSLDFTAAGIVEAGNQIRFGGTNRLLTSASFSTYNLDTGAQTSDATLTLYSVTGSTLGTMIGSYTTNFAFAPGGGPGVETIQFMLPSVLVPDDVVWTLSFSNANILLNYALPPGPSTGTLAGGAWWRNSGTGQALTLRVAPEVSGFESYNSVFTADAAGGGGGGGGSSVPEPSTALLLLAGAVAAGARRTRRS